MFLVGFGVGILVTGFVFIMWGHKNTEKITNIRNRVNDSIEDTFDGD